MYLLTLTARSPILIDGQFSSLHVDKGTARRSFPVRGSRDGEDSEQEPFLPASAIKGAMRIEFERLVRGCGRDVYDVNAAPEGQHVPSTDCIVCSLFGGPGRQAGKLRFYDARLDHVFARDAYDRRTNVSISRTLRKAQDKRLFNQEAAPAAMMYATRIALLEPLTKEEQTLLTGALDWWAQEGLWIGGNRSRGMGLLALSWSEEKSTGNAVTLAPEGESELYVITFRRDEKEQEPLRAGPGRTRDYLLRTLDFVPGSTVRGAVAAEWRRQGLSEADVSDAVLRRTLRFSHLYPGGILQIRPASALRCKENTKHGPYDGLMMHHLLRVAEDSDQNEAHRRLHKLLTECPECGKKLMPAERMKAPARRLMVKLALDRQLGRSSPGKFYVYETLSGSEEFSGLIQADPGVAEALRSLSNDGLLLGGGRSKGFGKGTVRVDGAGGEEFGGVSGTAKRLEALNGALRRTAVRFKIERHTRLEERIFFSLFLLTDLAPPPGRTLREILTAFGWQWEIAMLHWTRLGGFSEMSGWAKPLVTALERGGVVMLSTPATDKASVIERLAELEREGLGLLRDQGFGWIRACHEFHYTEHIREN